MRLRLVNEGPVTLVVEVRDGPSSECGRQTTMRARSPTASGAASSGPPAWGSRRNLKPSSIIIVSTASISPGPGSTPQKFARPSQPHAATTASNSMALATTARERMWVIR